MRCSSPAELDRSNERGVEQDVVSSRDQVQEYDRQTDQRACGSPCGQERLRCDELLGCQRREASIRART